MASDEETESASGRLFDLRELISGLFTVFGVMLVIAGIFDGQAEIDKASGVRINLWAGFGMIVVAIVFFVWQRWKPLRKEDLVPVDDDDAGPPAGH